MNNETSIQLIYEEETEMRLDAFLSSCYAERSRSYFQKLIREGRICRNGETVKKNGTFLKEGDEIAVDFPEPSHLSVEPEDIPLEIVYEDEDLLVVNKPRGQVVHPSYGHLSGTLVNGLLYHCRDLSGINGVLRPGIVHRIDKDTTGLLVVCKNDAAHRFLAEQFQVHSNVRKYEAIVRGSLSSESGTIDRNIERSASDRKKYAVGNGGKRAVTHYRVLERFPQYTLAEFQLETGRTHQIRVHMASLQHPILGDPVYGGIDKRLPVHGQMLHAKTLGFVHPRTKTYMEFQADRPSDFETVLKTLRGNISVK